MTYLDTIAIAEQAEQNGKAYMRDAMFNRAAQEFVRAKEYYQRAGDVHAMREMSQCAADAIRKRDAARCAA